MPSHSQYKVVYPTGAKCRKHKSTSSKYVGDLAIGTIVTVEQIDGRRCKISSPMKGWVSLHTSNGQNVLQRNISEGPMLTNNYDDYEENRDEYNYKKKKISKFKKMFNKNSGKQRNKCYSRV
eukprot:133928_1